MSPQRTQRTLAEMLAALRRQHGPCTWESRGKGIDVLVRMLLAQNTNVTNAAAGYKQLRRAFPRWQQVLDAPVRDVQRQIAVCGLARLRARRLQDLLRTIREQNGRLTLEHLKRQSPDDAYAYLTSFFGIGPKTANLTLLFSFGMPVFPVDRVIQRIARRSGLCEPRASEAVIGRRLTPHIPPTDRYAMHVLMHRHGKQFCRPKNPKCRECALLNLCPFGKKRVKHQPPPKIALDTRFRPRPLILSGRMGDGIDKNGDQFQRNQSSSR